MARWNHATHGRVSAQQFLLRRGMSFEIALVNNIALLPVEYAKDLKTAHDSPRALRAGRGRCRGAGSRPRDRREAS